MQYGCKNFHSVDEFYYKVVFYKLRNNIVTKVVTGIDLLFIKIIKNFKYNSIKLFGQKLFKILMNS